MRLTPHQLTMLAGEVSTIASFAQMSSHRAYVEAQMRYEDGRESDDYD